MRSIVLRDSDAARGVQDIAAVVVTNDEKLTASLIDSVMSRLIDLADEDGSDMVTLDDLCRELARLGYTFDVLEEFEDLWF